MVSIPPSKLTFFAVLLAVSSLAQGADVVADSLTVNTKAVINGSDPGTLGTNKTSIGGGIFRSTGGVYAGGEIQSGGSISIGTLGSYLPGSVYSDVNWGMLFRARQTSPVFADFSFHTSTDASLLNLGVAGSVFYQNSITVQATTGDASVVADAGPTGNIASVRLGTARAGGHVWDLRSWGTAFAGQLVFTDMTANADRFLISKDGVTSFFGTTTGFPVTGANIDGKVFIGGGRLAVGGLISAKEVKVTSSGADYVFENGYALPPLSDVQRYVALEKHLPGIMPARDMQSGGLPVAEVVTAQLAKIEELTLYAIQADSERRVLADKLEAVTKRLEALEARK